MGGVFGGGKGGGGRSVAPASPIQTPIAPIAPLVPSSIAPPPNPVLPSTTFASPLGSPQNSVLPSTMPLSDTVGAPIGQLVTNQTPNPQGAAPVAPGGGGANPAQFPIAASVPDEPSPMPQSIPGLANAPSPMPQGIPLGNANDAESFLTNFANLQFGPGGIMGGAGRTKQAGQSDIDFLRQLEQLGLFG